MELKDMTLEDVEARISELDSMVETSEDVEAINNATEERKALNERKAELKDLAERKALAKELEQGKKPDSVIEERKEDRAMVKIEEYRNSKEYVDAFAEFVKTGKDEELRALLTVNVGDAGTVAVPTIVMDKIKTAWDKNEIMSRTFKTTFAANVQQEFEISGDDAVIHNEGSGAISEETLTHGIVEIIPEMIMKDKGFSREVMKMRGEAFLNYIYDELAYRVIKKLSDVTVGKIAALPTSATSTTPNAAAITEGVAMGTVASAIGNLSDEAEDLVIIMNKLTWSAFKAAQYANGYGVDPFENLPVLYNNTLPAYSVANTNDVYMLVGSLKDVQVNYPGGESIDFIFDEISKKKEGIVEITGSQYVGVGVTACKRFTLVKKPAAL